MLAAPYLPDDLPAHIDREKLLTLLSGRIAVFSEIPEKIGFFLALPEYDVGLFPNKKNKVTLEACLPLLTAAEEALAALPSWDNDTLFAALSTLAETMGVKAGAIFWCLRIAVSGQVVTPGGATEIMEVLGQTESLSRIAAAKAKF